MGTADRKVEMTGGMEDPVYEPRTGVWQEQAKGYKTLGGGVRVPSGNAETGQQLGPAQQIPNVVHFTPGDDGVVVDFGIIPKQTWDQIMAEEATVEGRYKRLTDAYMQIKTGTVGEAKMPEVVQPAAVKVAEDELLAAAPPPPIDTNKTLHMMADALTLLTKRVVGMESAAKPVALAPQLPPEPKKPVEEALPPEVQVTFAVEGGGTWVSMFHAVQQNGNTLALIYDKRFKFSSRFYPPVLGDEKEVAITIQSAQSTKSLVGFSVGLGFSFANWDFTILIIAPEAQG
jgi:hypothetical protein